MSFLYKDIFCCCVSIFMFIMSSGLMAQNVSDTGNIFYKDESTFSFLFNSNGYGINYRYGKRINAFSKTTYNIDFVEIKHPRETKSTNVYNTLGKSFTYGKLNKVYNLRFGIGAQKELFKKNDNGGVSIRRFFSFGPSMAMLKPVYFVVIIDPNTGSIFESKFNSLSAQHQSPENIAERSSFFKGIEETTFTPGLFGKIGCDFEYSTTKNVLHAIEAAVSLDVFLKKIPIMQTYDNNFIFLTFTAAYRFGRIRDAKIRKQKTMLDELLTD